MSLPKVDLPHLAAFVHACDFGRMSLAADALGLTLSTLSARLHSLEARVGLKLFARNGRNMLPLPSSVWLYNRSVRLLLAEEFLRLRISSGAHGAIRSFVVQLDDVYTGTHLARAVEDAIRTVHSMQSACFIDLIFSRRSTIGTEVGQPILMSGSLQSLELSIHSNKGRDRGHPSSILTVDHWTSVSDARVAHGKADALEDLVVPELPGTLSDDIVRHLSRANPPHDISVASIGLQDYFGIAGLMSTQSLLLPSLLVPARLTASTHQTPLSGMPPCVVQVRASGADPVMETLLVELRRRLLARDSARECLRPFDPVATLKQIGTLNLVVKTGGMRSAARAAGLTAPMIPTQIAQLETALGSALITRSRGGSRATESSVEVQEICVGIEHCFNDALRKSRKIAAESHQSIRIGLPPSWGSVSSFTECMAVAIGAFHHEFPQCRIEVIDGPRDVLNGGVRSGELNIAVVGKAAPQVGSIAVGASEDIALIVNRGAGFHPRSRRVSADELRGIPLILAPAQLAMHQTLITALAKDTIQLEPVMRLGSIPLIVSVIRRSPFGTILPVSVVRNELEAGLVEAFPLDHIVPRRRLFAIFSTEDPLTDTERRLVHIIKDAFARPL